MNLKALFLSVLFVCCAFGAAFSQDSLVTVIAEKGDGIYSILRKQGIEPTKYYAQFVALNETNLRLGSHLMEGKEYILPYAPDSYKKLGKEINLDEGTEYPIFGKKFSFVKSKSKRLEGAVYYLVSGHGGPDPGAVETMKGKVIAEDEYAYDVTLRLARELLSHGAMVYIIVRDEDDGIREDEALEIDRDEVVYPNQKIPLGQLARLEQRVETVNKLYLRNSGKYQRLLVTHVDSRSKGQNIDVFFYHHEKSTNGERLAESIHKTFQKKYRKYQPNRQYTGTFSDRSNLYLVKNTLPAMAYIEIGNIRSQKDQKRILNPDNRQALANWIAQGVLVDRESDPSLLNDGALTNIKYEGDK
ncbi:N-acetylmuramoyl-L-alanine amidase [Saonia flava]|uniref:N-acetylmuramoyl-L-alanine amidase n=1 Tax=Saonia flava TaxID=523696 RepID=A0A846QV25_9FLAO|nr:N-acetylmuramoyl-L-alanine amidase [Saonia flava]NJB71868.1 N-acetylmuramoyl-L-alanine amidase [Saonia flava]